MIKFEDLFLTAINLLLQIPGRICIDDESDHKKTEYREVNWLDLPDHILLLITDRLIYEKDLIHFGAVCQLWQSLYTDIIRRRSHRLPLLMLATDEYNEDNTRSFYNLRDQTVYDAQVSVPHNMHCPGSSHGWLFTVCPKTFQICLLNPFLPSNDNKIHLPPLTTFHIDIVDTFHVGLLQKAVLSTNPKSDPNYVIMAIGNPAAMLSFYKSGDSSWTLLDSQFNNIVDVIYYRDQFYVVNRKGKVFSFDFNCHDTPKVSTVALYSPKNAMADKRYLVESLGNLLQVVRYTEYMELDDEEYDYDTDAPTYYMNNGFVVFKLDPIEQMWVKLDNLEGRILFVGHNSSLSISALDFPECKPDSIYFTDDFWEGYNGNEKYGIGGHDMGVYDLVNNTIEPHYSIEASMIYPPPIWIEPPPL